MRVQAIALAASLIWPGALAAQTAGPPLVLEAKIPFGEVSGRIDHLGIDLKRQRLLVAELSNNSLGVIDLAAARVFRTITGFSEPQGVAYVASMLKSPLPVNNSMPTIFSTRSSRDLTTG